jgi:hypothetical protein
MDPAPPPLEMPLTMADLKRMQTAGLLTLEEFMKEAAKLIRQAQAGTGAAADDDVQIVAQARPYRWYSENRDEQAAPAPSPAEADLLSEGSGLDDLSDGENENFRKRIVEEVRRKEEDAERRRLREELDYGLSDDEAEEAEAEEEEEIGNVLLEDGTEETTRRRDGPTTRSSP